MTFPFPIRRPYVVDAGPYAGVYPSRESYEKRLRGFLALVVPAEPDSLSVFDQDPWLDEGGGG